MTSFMRKQGFLLKTCIIAAIIIITSCSFCSAEETTGAGSSSVEKVEVYHFHPTNGCYTCTNMGKNAEDTVNTYFPKELESKRIIFDHINYQDPKNAELIKQYEVSGSSLMIGVYDADGFHKEENIKVWYLTGKKDESMTYLKEIIEKRLAGDFSE
ncbi:nitrophenyl compound nitroreductase subunit ArsF family protein [Methanospirillum sp.]|jgi:hypothetical protein